MTTFLKSKTFWFSFSISTLVLGIFFAWQLGAFGELLPLLPRPEPTREEIIFTVALIALLALNIGLFAWRKKFGSCPTGTRRASGLAGGIGAVTLLCPVCLLIPFSLFGLSFTLVFLVPYLPLLRVIALVLLVVSTWVLWPRKSY